MTRTPQGRAYALSAEQHQYLSQKAVAFTKKLNQPVSCRQVLDALLTLSLTLDEQALTDLLKQRLSEPRRHRKPQ